MEEFLITDEEKAFILKRRELAEKRKGTIHTQKPKPKAKDAVLGTNRPNEWDEHCSPCKVHRGRLTHEHPLYWFEERIFKKITNLQHKEQHKKISTILNIPVQNVFRDRQYHGLSHLDALWEQELLPLHFKIRYEEYKAKHGIGDDNVHPEHKKLKPDYVHPIPNKKRPWDIEKYKSDKSEDFKFGKKYRYAYDDEVGYSYKKAYKEEIKKLNG